MVWMTGRDQFISILWAPQHTVNDSLTLDCTDTWQLTAESDPRVRLSFHWQTNGSFRVARDGASMVSRGAEGHIKDNNPACDLLVSSSSTWERRWVTAEVRREEGLYITPQPHDTWRKICRGQHAGPPEFLITIWYIIRFETTGVRFCAEVY